MVHRVLWVLDNEVESLKFERLCTDLMYRAGYTEIEPYGGCHDNGRDAESRLAIGTELAGGTVFFQYSQEATWQRKLKRELDKVYQSQHQITTFVFVSSRAVTGFTRDKLKKEVANQYGWELVIYEREWLRVQLEEAHPDLAAKYLGIETNSFQSLAPFRPKPPSGPNDQENRAWHLYQNQDYDGAAVEFKKWVAIAEKDVLGWNALSWCQYRLYRYQEALVSIGKALAIDEENVASLTIKASILTEDGILRDSRSNLVMAKDIFSRVAQSSDQWVDHFNLANALSGLNEYEAARDEYLRSIQIDPKHAMVWKNLSSVWGALGNREDEARCLDVALHLNPGLPEALVCQGINSILNDSQPADGIVQIEKAIASDENIVAQWPHVYYWLAKGYYLTGNLAAALQRIEIGLGITPHHSGLLNMKGQILAEAWRTDRSFLADAESYFRFVLEATPEAYPPFEELARIVCVAESENAAWSLIDDYVIIPNGQSSSSYLKMVGYSFDEVLIGLRFLGSYRSFRAKSRLDGIVAELEQLKIAKDRTFRHVLFLACGVSFGLVCEKFATTPIAGRKVPRVRTIFSEASATLERVIPRLASLLSSGIVDTSVDTLAAGIAKTLVAVYNLALLEVSGQIGYAAAVYKVDAGILNRAMPSGKKLADWTQAIMGETLLLLNDSLKFVGT